MSLSELQLLSMLNGNGTRLEDSDAIYSRASWACSAASNISQTGHNDALFTA